MTIVDKKNKCKEILLKAAEPYYEEEITPHSGQFKLLKKSLMIRHIAVSTNKRIRSPKETKAGKSKESKLNQPKETRMTKYLDSILNMSNREIIAVFDPGRNLTSFLCSVYCKGMKNTNKLQENMFSKEGEMPFPPYLLLQEVRRAVENSMIQYINIKESDKVEEAYVDFLIGVAWYEIILKEFFQKLKNKLEACALRISQLENCDELEQLVNQYTEWENRCDDIDVGQVIAEKMAEDTAEYLSALNEIEITLRIAGYFIRQQTNFFALLRILALVEWVNINCGHNNARNCQGRMEYLESQYWIKLMRKCMEEKSFFGFTDRKRNLEKLYRKYNQRCREASLLPILENEDMKYKDFRTKAAGLEQDIEKYLESIKIHISENGERQEDSLWELEMKLAFPVMMAAEKILAV